jgi:AraC family transcriptional regulator of arabinose operon
VDADSIQHCHASLPLPSPALSGTINFVSEPIISQIRDRPYDQPFSGKGIEYDPLGVQPGRTGLTLHETGFLPANTNWNYSGVYSPFWRLHYNWHSGHQLRVGDRQVELTPEHIVLTPHHVMIQLRGGNPVEHLWMHFNFTRQIHAESPVPIQLSLRDTEQCLLRDLKGLILAKSADASREAVFRNSLALLQVVLARPELVWQADVPANLVRAREHIEAHIGGKLAIPALARLAGMSEAGLNRAFKRHYSTSPARFISEIRIREVARLLQQTDESIEDIADQTGFPNRAYLSRVFKQVTGESPADFRRKHR